MKILLLAPQPFYTQRGTPIAVRLLAEELAQMGHEVDLLVYWEGKDIEIPGVKIKRAKRVPGIRKIPIGFSYRKIIADFSLFLTFIRMAVLQRYDVIHAVEETVFFAATTRWLHRAKVIYDMDSSLAQQMTREFPSSKLLHRLFHAMEGFAIRRSDVIIAVCEELAVTARKFVSASTVFVLNDIVPPEARMESASDKLCEYGDSRAVLAVYVGNLESYQGVDLLVDAAACLSSDKKVRIIIIGGSPEDIESYSGTVQERGLGDRIHFIGKRPLTQLMAYLEQADILVSPRSSGNNTPLKIYCYMSAGKAIVATDIVSHTQVLSDKTAVLVAPTATAIAEALSDLTTNADLRVELGERAKSESEAKYTIHAFRSTLAAAYAVSSPQNQIETP